MLPNGWYLGPFLGKIREGNVLQILIAKNKEIQASFSGYKSTSIIIIFKSFSNDN